MKKFQGVTLIEVLVVIVIIGILALIAIPSYRSYLIENNRKSAHVALQNTASLIEQYLVRKNKNNFTNGNLNSDFDRYKNGATDKVFSENNLYVITIDPSPNPGFIVKAEAQSTQQTDTKCYFMMLDNNGVRSSEDVNNNPTTDCWK